MRLSIQRLRWVLVAGALLLVTVLAVYIGYGHYRMMSAYRRILARSGVSISRDSNGVTYSQSVGGKKIFTLRAAKETSLGDGKWTLHDADLLLYTRSAEHPDHIYGKDFEYDQNDGVLRALGEVYMDLQAPDAFTGTGHARTPAEHGEAGGPATAGPKPAQEIHVRTSGLVYLRKLGVAATDRQVEFDYGGMQCKAMGAEFNTGQNVLRLLAHVSMDGVEHGQPVHLTAVKADIDRTANEVNLTQPVVVSNARQTPDRGVGNRTARADRAVLDLRKDGSIEQVHGLGDVVLSAGTQMVTAEHLDASLSPQAVPETAQLSGNVLLVDKSEQRPIHGTARQVDAVFDAQGAPAKVVATGATDVSMVDRSNPAAGPHGLEREMQGDKIVALFVPGPRKNTSRLSELHITGMAHMRGESLIAVAKGPAAPTPQSTDGASGNRGPGAGQSGGLRLKTVQVAADDLRVLFVAGGGKQVQPQRLYGTGHTVLEQDAPLGEQEISRGNTLEATFASAPVSEASVENAQNAGGIAGKEQLTLVSAVQAGQVTIYSRAAARDRAGAQGRAARQAASPGPNGAGTVSTAGTQRAVYDGAARTLTLSGDTRLTSGDVSLVAPTVVLDQQTGNAEARGGVETTMLNAPAAQGAATNAEAKPVPATHVVSATATFDHELKLSEFRGSDADPARMWQDASQVQAAVLVLDGVRHTFSARPAAAGALVHAVFAGSSAEPVKPGPGSAKLGAAEGRPNAPAQGQHQASRPKPGPGSGPVSGGAMDYVRVASPKMDYNDVRREATFSGGVQIDGTMGEVRGERAAVFMMPAAKGRAAAEMPGSAKPVQPGAPTAQSSPLNGSLDRVVVSGDVRMEQPGRQGTGEQLLYTAATGSYVLTGSPGRPPRVIDAQQGNVTGTTLLFGAAGSTIVVAGAPGAPQSGHGRVRTETEVRQ